MSQTILPADLGRIFADPAAYADPVAWHEAARQLRQEAPIARVSLPEYQDFWAITRHADIMEIERNPAVFTNAPIPTILPRAAYETQRANTEPPAVNTLIQMDGEEHKAHRGIVNDWFKPASIKRMSDRIDALAKEWVDRMAAMGGQCDFANDIAMHYPLQVILSILGLPEDDHQKDAEADAGALRGRGPRHRPGERGRHRARRHARLRQLLHRPRLRPAGPSHRGLGLGHRQRRARRGAPARHGCHGLLPHHRHGGARHHVQLDRRRPARPA